MNTVISKKDLLPGCLRDGIFADRKSQFVDRLNWNLCVTQSGHEVDEYDDGFSDYLVVHDAYRHLGSCRVRPITEPTMIIDHFLGSFPEAREFLSMQRGRLFELTRFCRAPNLSAEQSKFMMKHMTHLMDHYRDSMELSGYVAVVFPAVARFMDTIGMRYIILSQSKINGQLAYLICITQSSRSVSAPLNPSMKSGKSCMPKTLEIA